MPNGFFVNQYAVLGVPNFAPDEVIKIACRKLARKYHPDRNKAAGAGEKFQSILAAKQILTDKTEKQAHDVTLQVRINSETPGLTRPLWGCAFWLLTNHLPLTPQNTSSRARFSAEALNVFDVLIRLGRMTEADITNISDDRIHFVSQPECLSALKDNVFSLAEFNDIYSERLASIMSPICLKALREQDFSLDDLSAIDAQELCRMIAESRIDDLESFVGQIKGFNNYRVL